MSFLSSLPRVAVLLVIVMGAPSSKRRNNKSPFWSQHGSQATCAFENEDLGPYGKEWTANRCPLSVQILLQIPGTKETSTDSH